MAMSLFPFMMEPSVTSLKTTTYRSEKLHLYLIEKDEMEKKDPEVKDSKRPQNIR
jgi:hypothetical protein